jgi:hypothetical protein
MGIVLNKWQKRPQSTHVQKQCLLICRRLLYFTGYQARSLCGSWTIGLYWCSPHCQTTVELDLEWQWIGFGGPLRSPGYLAVGLLQTGVLNADQLFRNQVKPTMCDSALPWPRNCLKLYRNARKALRASALEITRTSLISQQTVVSEHMSTET